eukprot:9466898-Pyramimonas_sp.AAC.1
MFLPTVCIFQRVTNWNLAWCRHGGATGHNSNRLGYKNKLLRHAHDDDDDVVAADDDDDDHDDDAGDHDDDHDDADDDEVDDEDADDESEEDEEMGMCKSPRHAPFRPHVVSDCDLAIATDQIPTEPRNPKTICRAQRG